MFKPNKLEEDIFQDYMTGHNPLYLFELDGNNLPEELLSSVLTRLGSMAVKQVCIPLPLHQTDDEELPEDINTVYHS